MSSYPYKHLCTHCKLNKNCDYECMEARYSFFFCPRFVNDDGQPFTNAEVLSSILKENVELATNFIWCLLTTSKEDHDNFEELLKEEYVDVIKSGE